MPLLDVAHLRKTYGGRRVVDDVSFSVDRGEIVGLLGRNGAGKTTSFRMVMGMIEPDAKHGAVQFNGRDVSRLAMYQRARLGIGYLSQEPSIFQRLSVEKNLTAILQTRRGNRSWRQEKLEELLTQFDLGKTRKQAARTLSGGERRKLEIARALVTDPKLILLDEPFSGVDPRTVENLQEEIRALRDMHGIAILITDHNVHQTLRVCDRAYIIDQGRIFADGAPRELINDANVKRVYLGSLFRGDEFDDRDGAPTVTVPGPKARI